MADDNDWKRRFGAPGRPGAADPCPSAERRSVWASGPLSADAIAHLATCATCREDLLAVRRQHGKTERISGDLRARLHGLQRRPAWPLIYGAAAAAVVLIAGLIVLSRPPEPVARVIGALPAPSPRKPAPPEHLPPEPPRPAQEPSGVAPIPEAPKPIPAPVQPVPFPEPPVVATPAPAPEKPAPVVPVPVPEKPAPEPTRAALKGSLLAVAGTCSVQADGDAAALPLKPGQKRDFPGTVRVKADAAAVKLAIGTATVYVQRNAELSIQLQEGRTHVQLAHGEAFFDVTPGNGLFEVDGSQGRVVVKGTRFLVSETDVLVQRGAVENTAGGQTVTLTPTSKPKADLVRRLAWVRSLEDFLWIEGEQMAVQGGMVVLADATASGGRAIGLLKPGVEGTADIRGKRKQLVPYAVWVRLLWPHNVPSALSLSIADLRWTSKDVVAAQGWQWVRAGSVELPDEAFKLRLSDTKVGLKVDQVLITSDPDFNPETDKR